HLCAGTGGRPAAGSGAAGRRHRGRHRPHRRRVHAPRALDRAGLARTLGDAGADEPVPARVLCAATDLPQAAAAAGGVPAAAAAGGQYAGGGGRLVPGRHAGASGRGLSAGGGGDPAAGRAAPAGGGTGGVLRAGPCCHGLGHHPGGPRRALQPLGAGAGGRAMSRLPETRVLTDWPAFEAVAGDWAALHARVSGALYSSHHWLAAMRAAFGLPGAMAFVTLWQGGRMVAAAPMVARPERLSKLAPFYRPPVLRLMACKY